MRYDEIFRDMVNTIVNDYAGYEEKKLLHDSMHFSLACQDMEEQGQMNDLVFMRMMNEYLVTLQDRNLQFRLKDSKEYQACTNGFDVRSFSGKLFVTRVDQETRLQPGDQIAVIDSVLPEVFKKQMQKNCLASDLEERELWGPVLKMANRCMIKRLDGTVKNITLKKYPVKKKLPRLGGRLIGKDTLYLDLAHFADEESVEKLIAAKEKSLARCNKLILDLRHNVGGSESAFLPLLDYIFPEKVLVKDLYEDQGLYTNYTENNCRRKKEMFEQFLPQVEGDAKALVEELMAELDEKSGQGMIWEEDVELAEDDTVVGGKCVAEKIVILSDTYCEYAGETFIQLCKKSPRVTVVGRPTMGNVDYCNPISVLYNDKFTFSYPISKTKVAKEGKGVSGRGVEVDQYIPWTPVECSADVILNRAIAL
ncbi:MAG: hypothetical protein II347_05550 [Lachnospiraceae bacterium]|nr:hypothetical protein [Lachnospiraceae bacterium]